MNFKPNYDPVIYYEGKPYPISVYMQALHRADTDGRLKAEIEELNKKYISLHLELLMKEYEND